MRRVAGILAVGALCAAVDGFVRPFELVRAKSHAAPAAAASPGGEAARIFALYSDPGVVFVDASAPNDFRAGRIPGAKNFPPEAFLGGATPDDLGAISRGATVVVYCRSARCDAAEFVALRLTELGFSGTTTFRGGFDEWRAAGYPTQSGP